MHMTWTDSRTRWVPRGGVQSTDELETMAGRLLSRLPSPCVSRASAVRQFEVWRSHTNPYDVELRNIAFASRRAASLLDSGDAAAAEPHARQAEASARTLLGPRHPQTLSCLLELSNSISAQGKSILAEPLAEELVTSCRDVLGTRHQLTIKGTVQLATVRALGMRYAEAEALLREAAQSAAALLGGEHPTTLHAESSLTQVIAALGRHDEAAVRMRRELGPPPTRPPRELLGWAHGRTRAAPGPRPRRDGDEASCRRPSSLPSPSRHPSPARAGATKAAYGAASPEACAALANYTRLLHAQDKFGEAEPLLCAPGWHKRPRAASGSLPRPRPPARVGRPSPVAP